MHIYTYLHTQRKHLAELFKVEAHGHAKSSFSITLICTTNRQIPASCSTNQRAENGALDLAELFKVEAHGLAGSGWHI
jgi:hypothetical protein